MWTRLVGRAAGWHAVLVGLLAVGIACSSSASNSAPGSGPPPSATGGPKAAGGTQPTLRVGLVGVATSTYGPVYAAQDLGLYARNGIIVEATDYQSGSAAQEALAAGEADIIHYFPAGVATAVAKGVKEKLIATDQYLPAEWHIVVAAGSNIKTPQDLNGKKIGVTGKGSTSDFFALWFLQKTGVTADVVPLGNSALYPSTVAGQIDAAVLTPPLILQGFQKNEVRSLFAFQKEMGPTLPSALAASDKLIADNPDAISRYLKSLYAGIRYLKQDAEYCGSFMARHTNQERSIADLTCKNVISTYSEDGQIKRDWLDTSLAVARLGGLTDIPPIEQFFTEQFTPVKLD